MHADAINDTYSHSRKVNMQEKLLEEIQLLVSMIEYTEFADPIDVDIMTMQRIYRDCLEWRLVEIEKLSPPMLAGNN